MQHHHLQRFFFSVSFFFSFLFVIEGRGERLVDRNLIYKKILSRSLTSSNSTEFNQLTWISERMTDDDNVKSLCNRVAAESTRATARFNDGYCHEQMPYKHQMTNQQMLYLQTNCSLDMHNLMTSCTFSCTPQNSITPMPSCTSVIGYMILW